MLKPPVPLTTCALCRMLVPPDGWEEHRRAPMHSALRCYRAMEAAGFARVNPVAGAASLNLNYFKRVLRGAGIIPRERKTRDPATTRDLWVRAWVMEVLVLGLVRGRVSDQEANARAFMVKRCIHDREFRAAMLTLSRAIDSEGLREVMLKAWMDGPGGRQTVAGLGVKPRGV